MAAISVLILRRADPARGRQAPLRSQEISQPRSAI